MPSVPILHQFCDLNNASKNCLNDTPLKWRNDSGEAELRNTFWLVSRDQNKKHTSEVLRDIWKYDRRVDWHF